MKRLTILLGLWVLVLAASACGDDTPDPAADAGLTGLTGTVKDPGGVPVSAVKVQAGGAMTYTDSDGKYSLTPVIPGAVTVKMTQGWFQAKQTSAVVKGAGLTGHDASMVEVPMKILAADRTLAPTRGALDLGLHYHNPALHRDTSKEKPLTPSPAPTIVSKQAKGFTFPGRSAPHKGTEVLDLSTLVDDIKDTPLTAAEQQQPMIFKPMRNWLVSWDATKAAGINAAGAAVRLQTWGSSAVRPQDMEMVYLHGKQLWVKVVFEPFVTLGAGVSDTDKDKRKEVFARVNASLYTDEVIDKLEASYLAKTFNTHGMSKEIAASCDELYTTTGAQVARYIGQPYTMAGAGKVEYPFVVLKHTGGFVNVLLLGP